MSIDSLFDMVFRESCVQLEQFQGTDLGLYQITINKSADFLIVTRQNPHFSRILAENRLHDQKNGCFLDRNSMILKAIVKWQTLKHADVKYETLNRVLCALRF